MPLRLIFMGTPAFAVPVLRSLIDAGHDLCCVYSQPPRPAGRGQQLRPSPVHVLAESCGIAVRTPATLKAEEDRAAFAALQADAAVVVAYGLILPRPILAAPRLGCLNLHASLLPRWRGAAPIQRAVMAGDAETGVAVMQMEAGLDTGPVLLERRVPIGPRTTSGDLQGQLAALGGPMMLAALDALASSTATVTAQPTEGVTYASKIDKAEGRIDWRQPAPQLDRLIRALGESPGTWCEYAGQRLKVLVAEPAAGRGDAGTVLDTAPTIACGEGALRLLTVQPAGKSPMPAASFCHGQHIGPGARFT